MRSRIKYAATVAGVTAAVCGASFCLTGCTFLNRFKPQTFTMRELSDMFAVSMIGNDVFAWNVFSLTPEESFGYERYGTPSWYSYSETTQKDMDDAKELLSLYRRELDKFDLSDLDKADADTYRAMDYVLDTYETRFGSRYAVDFSLMSASYISSEGGYVADFASSVENFEFRSKQDVQDLLEITLSTKDAFGTYLDYAQAREDAGFPLYDVTITAMQDYLNSVYEQGDGYYLYSVIDTKLDKAEFLSESDKTSYKADFKDAFTDRFMSGVRDLSVGLDEYKGNVETTQKSYLASYGSAGKAYYKWLFQDRTGMVISDFKTVYNDMVDAFNEYLDGLVALEGEIEALKNSDPATYAEVQEFLNGERLLLGLSDPAEMMEYLKTAAVKIVPELKSAPEIDFKYMDDTVAQISNTSAYYLKSPIDQENAPEHITINGYIAETNPYELLPTIAHEGYPGHLYAYVYAKENGMSLLASSMGCLAFSEGWSKYVEWALMDVISSETDDKATKLYCEYYQYNSVVNYISMALYDLQVNYFGYTVQDYVDMGESEEFGRMLVETVMEIPAVYIPYGYGYYYMLDLHDRAKEALYENYDEVEFNGKLLSEGFGPTLERASKITDEYIKENW